MIISLFRKSPISLITSVSFLQDGISNALYFWVRRTWWYFCSQNIVLGNSSYPRNRRVSSLEDGNIWKQKRLQKKVFFLFLSRNRKKLRQQLLWSVKQCRLPNCTREKIHQHIHTYNLAVCTASWLYVLQASARQGRRGLKTIGFSAFSKYWRHHDMPKQYQHYTEVTSF